MPKLRNGNTGDSNPGSLDCESGVLPTELPRSTNSIDSKQHCAGVFIDLKKAFDTVNHELLVEQLSIYGVRGVANAWL